MMNLFTDSFQLKKDTATKLYSLSVVMFSPFGLYATGVMTFMFNDVLLFVSSFYLSLCLLKDRREKYIEYPLLFIIGYVFFNALVFALGDTVVLLRTCRFLFYIVYVCLFVSFFSLEQTLSIYKNVALFSTLFLYIQFALFKFFGYYLPGYLSFLPISREELVSHTTNIYTAIKPRLRSIYSEPAEYAEYVSFCLFVLLLKSVGKKKKGWDFFLCILFTIGIVISESTTGFVLGAISWLVYFVMEIKNGKKLDFYIYIPIIGALIFLFFSQSEGIQNSVFRITDGADQEGRLVNSFDVFHSLGEMSLNTLFGNGMLLLDVFVSSYGRMLIFFGFAGIGMFALVYGRYAQKNIIAFMVFFYMFIMGFGTLVWVSGNLMLYTSFLIYLSKNGTLFKDTKNEIFHIERMSRK